MKNSSPKALGQQDPKICAGYIRVSTLEQADESLSLERQEKAVRDKGATVLFQDIDSGSKDDRKALQRLMELARRGEIDEVVVSRIDRLTRSLRQLLDQGGFMLASEKPDGLGWRDRGCNQEWFERPSDGRGE